MITLPTQKVPATSTNPQYLVLYGLPKAGKTSAVAQLENNLIIDLEGGSKFIDALAVQARTINELGEIAQAIRAKNDELGHNFYKHITIDNATRLEDICMSYACTLYRQTELGKNWKGTDVTTLARGAGYKYLRDAVKKVIHGSHRTNRTQPQIDPSRSWLPQVCWIVEYTNVLIIANRVMLPVYSLFPDIV